MSDFSVAIVGRPNVGKSHLFNLLLGKRKAIVDETPEVTRDRLLARLSYKKREFTLIDTGGISLNKKDTLSKKILEQTTWAIREANLLVLVCDVKDGVVPLDIEISNLLRKFKKGVTLVVNKVDNDRLKTYVDEFYSLGLGKPLAVSATNKIGIGELLEEITAHIPLTTESQSARTDIIKIAIIGRPNVGKSSFLNCLLGQERVIVSEIPGTTRDSIDTFFEKEGQKIMLIDTAGITHKKKLRDRVSFFGRVRTLESIRRSDVCLILLDAKEGLINDDIGIINTVIEEGRCCIIVVNKWDLLKGVLATEYEMHIRRGLPILRDYPIIFVSAKTGFNVLKTLEIANSIFRNLFLRIPQKKLDDFLKEFVLKRLPPSLLSSKGAQGIKMSQFSIRPTSFFIESKRKNLIKKETLKFIENRMRENFNFFGTPIRIFLK